jgi:mannose-6-phosphate isomerase-like protein (cupin superfamily)
MSKPDRSHVVRFAEAQRKIPGPAGEHSISLLQRGTLNLKLSLPVLPNQQTPHTQDEIYVIVRGRGVLFHDGARDSFGPGDVMFVAAGTEHHFEDFTDDLAVWVVFFGPDGGEVPLDGVSH